MPDFLKLPQVSSTKLSQQQNDPPRFGFCSQVAPLTGISFYDNAPTSFLTTNTFTWDKELGGKKNKSRFPIQHEYNKHMNSVDVADSLVKKSCYIRSSKWYRRLSSWVFDTGIANISLLFRLMHPKHKSSKHIPFIMELSVQLLSNFVPLYRGRQKPFQGNPMNPKRKFDPFIVSTTRHTPDYTTYYDPSNKTRPQCRICKKRPKTICQDCGVGLCLGECWLKFHSQ